MSWCKKSNPISSMGEEDVMVLGGACGRVFVLFFVFDAFTNSGNKILNIIIHFGPKEPLFYKF